MCLLLARSPLLVYTICCVCLAGLLGCSNHVTATLYCLEDYIHFGLQEDEQKGFTE